MSDSDDFGGLGDGTPVPQQKRKAPSGGAGRSEKPPSKAGPSNSGSTKPPSKTNNGPNPRKKAKTETAAAGSSKRKPEEEDTAGEDSDVRQILVNEIEDEEDEDVQEIAPPPPKQRGGSKKPVSKDSGPAKAGAGAAAAGASSKAKGKQKAAPASAAASIPAGKRAGRKDIVLPETEDAEEMDVDAEEPEVLEIEEDVGSNTKGGANKKGAAPNGTFGRPNGQAMKQSRIEQKLAAENARLKDEVQRLKGHIDDLKSKFEELLHTRQTEPEALMEEMTLNHERQINVQKELINELHAQLARKEPLLRGAMGKKSSGFGLVSRDEVDHEVQEYKNQIQGLRSELTATKKVVAQKDEEIALCKQLEKEIRFELKTEIERSEQLSKQNRVPPGSATRGGAILKGDDPKIAKVITLYEDLTSIIVPTVKFTPAQYEGDEWTFTCVYTWRDELDKKIPEKSLNFALRLCKEAEAGTNGPLVDTCHYLPLSLEMESPEFVESLGFLNKPFSFPKTQLSLFVRTLYDNLTSQEQDDDDD